MATSEQSAIVAGIDTALGDDAGDTAAVRDAVNNLMHLADVAGRVIACVADASVGYAKWAGTSDGAWKPVWSSGVFYPLLRDDGSAYPIRVRIAGAAGSATGSKFRIGVCPVGTSASMMAAATLEANVVETATITSTTPAWLSTLVASIVQLSAAQVSDALAEVPIFDAVSSASPRSVVACPCTIEVWTKDLVPADNTPVVSGVFALEEVGL